VSGVQFNSAIAATMIGIGISMPRIVLRRGFGDPNGFQGRCE
jgi:hypothetical protein